MKKLYILFLLLPSLAFGGSLKFDFKSITVSELARLAFVDVLRVPYVILPEVLADSRAIAFSVVSKDSADSFEAIKQTLASLDIQLEKRGEVYFALKAKPDLLPSVSGVFSAPRPFSPVSGVASVSAPVLVPLPVVSSYIPHHRSPAYLAPIAELVGAKVLKDNAQSRLFFSSPPALVFSVLSALALADSPLQTFTIKVSLIEFTQSSDDQFSFGLDVISKRLNSSFHPVAALTNSLTYKGTVVSAIVSAIRGDSRFNYSAQPQIMVTDGETAVLSVGADVPVLGSTAFSSTGQPIQSITYRNSGVMLKVTPLVIGDAVQLTVEQENSTFQPTTSSNINSPTLSKRSIKTTLLSHVGESVLMAGLTETRDNDARAGLSFLPAFLQSKSAQKVKTQILLNIEISAVSPLESLK